MTTSYTNIGAAHAIERTDSHGLGAGLADWTNYIFSAFFVLIVVSIFTLASARCWHWFLLPVTVCGILTGADIISWLRRRLDTFDPKAIIGLLWFHGTFLAPLLHVTLELHSEYFAEVVDWPKWFGLWAALTAPGLFLYQVAHGFSFRRTRELKKVWVVISSRFFFTLSAVLAMSALAAAVLLVRFDALHKEARMFLDDFGALAHISWLLMLGDPLPLLIVVGLVYMLSGTPWRRSALLLVVLIVGVTVAQFLLLGFRGSRSAVIFVVFLVAALCHYRLRRVPLTWLMIGALFFGTAGYYYAFFKRFGTVGFEALRSADAYDAFARKAGISPLGVILGDLSRAEIQTFLLYRLREHPHDYQLRHGRTYAAAALMVIPRALWPTKPSDRYGKVAAGTDLQYGQGTYLPDKRRSSAVYGPAGEALLNFGFLGIPVSYLILGLILGWYRRKVAGFDPHDARFYLVPLFSLCICIAAFGDADNTVFGLLKHGFLLMVVVLLSCRRLPATFSISTQDLIHP